MTKEHNDGWVDRMTADEVVAYTFAGSEGGAQFVVTGGPCRTESAAIAHALDLTFVVGIQSVVA